ncbi:hypothetical protein TTHERM_00371100 (macronuclear) [Tetrahymena thermophila SB210]|uniref:Leucine Rich Repeat family protein n=1 Tax=Tetrahymena thermophila (strain SB210) TaxID=312017 RepID=I7MDK4_TETTS|nr:hypothetical protein TTHERM_00371100 [Tetrahymena thermophila SB210]EAR89295.2 hypothetical protein TTHERM_00371100 [Tetrahymena thermophila SB210]|eukprot:XP_001009540.2 hypothetical protein TTHERM_00371100 [Tetrahymena thermophila SB210]
MGFETGKQLLKGRHHNSASNATEFYASGFHDDQESILMSVLDDSQMDQITAAVYQSYNDSTMNSSYKHPFMTEIQQNLDTSANLSLKQVLVHSEKKFNLKEERKMQHFTNKLPSINASDDLQINSMNSFGSQGLIKSSKMSQKYINQMSREDLPSRFSIDPEQYLQNEQEIPLLPNEQREWFLPQLKKNGVQLKTEKEIFYQQYKKLSKITQYDKRYKTNKFIYKSMCQKAEECNLLPKTFEIFKSNSCVHKELNLNNYGIGEQYCKVFSEALQVEDLQHLKKLKISQNNLRGGSLNKIFKSCASKMKVLDISGNSVRQEDLATFKPLFARTTLAFLNIAQCRIGDTGFTELYQNIKENQHLKVLNISMNNLTEISAEKLKKLLTYNTSLQELYLHWNNFKNEGGCEILKGVLENSYLKVFDISYNSLKYQGDLNEQNQQKAAAYYIAQILSKETSELLHLDVSYNNFSPTECKMIQESLFYNSWLFGLHFEGNSNYVVDSSGFIVELQNGFRPRMQHKRQIKSIHQIPFFQEDELWDSDQQQLQDICWICQGWQEVIIQAKDIQEEPLYLHLSYQNFKPELLKKNEEGHYIKSLMIPKNKKIEFFFSNPLESSKGLVTQYHESHRKIMSCHYKYKFDNAEKEYFLFVYHMNSIDADNSIQFEVNNHYKVKTKCFPREQSLTYHLPKSDWDISQSIWKDFRGDTEEILRKCLDNDLFYARIFKFVKDVDDQNQLREAIVEKYQICRDVYRNLASIQPQGDTFCIGLGVFQRMISKTKTLDGGKIKLSDIDRLFIATNFNQETNETVLENNPAKALIRYEFIEILVRIAHEKYPQMKYAEAFTYYFENDLKEHFILYQIAQDWRTNKYWKKEIEHEIKNEIQMIKPIYDSLVQKNPACYQSSIKYVDLVTFSDFIVNKICHLHPLNQALEIQIRSAFQMSLQTSIDELSSMQYKQMGLLEFIEAIVRISEVIYKNEDIPLNVKIQKILFEIYDEGEKQEILKRQEFEKIKRLQEEKKEIKRIILKTRKDYEFKQSVSHGALQRFSKVKLLSNQSKFLPSVFNNHQNDHNEIFSAQNIQFYKKNSK